MIRIRKATEQNKRNQENQKIQKNQKNQKNRIAAAAMLMALSIPYLQGCTRQEVPDIISQAKGNETGMQSQNTSIPGPADLSGNEKEENGTESSEDTIEIKDTEQAETDKTENITDYDAMEEYIDSLDRIPIAEEVASSSFNSGIMQIGTMIFRCNGTMKWSDVSSMLDENGFVKQLASTDPMSDGWFSYNVIYSKEDYGSLSLSLYCEGEEPEDEDAFIPSDDSYIFDVSPYIFHGLWMESVTPSSLAETMKDEPMLRETYYPHGLTLYGIYTETDIMDILASENAIPVSQAGKSKSAGTYFNEEPVSENLENIHAGVPYMPFVALAEDLGEIKIKGKGKSPYQYSYGFTFVHTGEEGLYGLDLPLVQDKNIFW